MSSLIDLKGNPYDGLPQHVKDSMKIETAMDLTDCLNLEQIKSLGFKALGPRIIAEPVSPETVTQSGIYAHGGFEKFPLYRIIDFGEPKENFIREYKCLQVGDIISSLQIGPMQIPNSLPRTNSGGQRVICMMDSSQIKGYFPGYAWPKEELEKMENINVEKQGIPQNLLLKMEEIMLKPSEICQIEYEPLGDQIVVERVPNQVSEGNIVLPGDGKPWPLYRILKIGNLENWTPYLNGKIGVGSLVTIHAVDENSKIPHRLRDTDGNKRNLYSVSVGLCFGHYPDYSWDTNEERVININSIVETGDDLD